MQAVWAAERMKDYLKNESWVIVCRRRELQTRKVLQDWQTTMGPDFFNM